MYHKYVYINLQLTDKGAKVCGAPTKTLEMPWNNYGTLDYTEVNKFINDEFMPELVDHIISVKPDLRNLNIGDYVCIITPGEKETRSLGKVNNVTDNGYAKEIIVTTCLNNNYNQTYRFNFAGYEIGGKRKDKKYIEVATPEYIEYCNKIKNTIKTYNEIYDLLNYTYEWEYADKIGSRETPPLFLNGEDLLKILEILETAKSKYDNAI